MSKGYNNSICRECLGTFLNKRNVDPPFCWGCRRILHENYPCDAHAECEGIKTGKSCYHWVKAWKMSIDHCAAPHCLGYPVPIPHPLNVDKYLLGSYCRVHLDRRRRAEQAVDEKPNSEPVPEKKVLRKARIAYFSPCMEKKEHQALIDRHENDGFYLETIKVLGCQTLVALFRKTD